VTGANVSESWHSRLLGDCVVNTVGVQVRNDSIPHVALHHTEQRELVNAVEDDTVDEFSTGFWGQTQVKWSDKVRTVLGSRIDYYHVDVLARDIPEDSGKTEAKRFSPKASLSLGPWCGTEFYLNGGYGFHSNDARGVVGPIGPAFTEFQTPTPQVLAPLIVPSRGAEIGFKSQTIPDLTTTFALWQLHLGSELVFSGDTGTTTPLRSSDRYGIEWSNTYKVCDWLTLNADYTWSHGRLIGYDPDTPGQHIPEMITTTFSGGPHIETPRGWFADLRFRYIGPRPLIEDESFSSSATQMFDLALGYRCLRYTAGLDILNLFNSNGHDIDYTYGTALKTDPGFPFNPSGPGVSDQLFRRMEPFAARFFFTMNF
jgi:hypothetical protein